MLMHSPHVPENNHIIASIIIFLIDVKDIRKSATDFNKNICTLKYPFD